MSQNSLESLIKSHDSLECEGEFYHMLRLHDDYLIVSSSLISAKVAEWNAMIRLQTLIENGKIEAG